MKKDFRDDRGFTKFRVISCTTVMRREQIKQTKEEEKEANRIARIKERQDKKFNGMESLF